MNLNIKRLLLSAFFFALLSLFYSCETENPSQDILNIEVELKLPKGMETYKLENFVLSFKNVTTSELVRIKNTEKAALEIGLYDLSFDGFAVGENNELLKLNGLKQSLEVIRGGGAKFSLPLFRILKPSGFVIEEIFFSSVLTTKGEKYTGCCYFKIRNNSDQLLYADSLAICESAFLTTLKFDYTPNIMRDTMSVHAIYMIPGKGTDVPVEAGKSLLIVDIAIDHSVNTPNGYDLSKADFEWYDDIIQDIDNPQIPNLERLYSYSKTVWAPHDRGYNAYAIAKIKTDKESTFKDLFYKADYIMNLPTGNYPMKKDAYKIPNSWIEDAVNLSVESEFKWIVVSPTLDMGWTFCGKVDNDKTRYGKSVRRKVSHITQDDREILQDTNNSAEDFIPEATPSMANK